MDVLTGSDLSQGRVLDLERGVAVRLFGGRSLLTRGWITAALAALGLVVGAWFTFVDLPSGFTVAEAVDGPVIMSVGLGSNAWMEGVRPGMMGEWTADGARFQIIYPSGHIAEFAARTPGSHVIELAAGSVLVLLGAVLALTRLPGGAATAGVGAAIALVPNMPSLGLPTVLPLALIPVLVALASVRIPDRPRQRRFDLFGLLVLGVIVCGAAFLMNGAQMEDWTVVWGAPIAFALVVGVAGEVAGARARYAALPPVESRGSRILAAFVPLAAKTRLEGADAERARMAIELHNRVVPRVASSAAEMRKEGAPDAAAKQLDALAADLRDVMRQHETVSLESAGVGRALRAQLEGSGTYGIRVSFDLREDGSGRPPANVELATFRIGQAAIDNALRHSGADRIEVLVLSQPDRVELVVSDDGVGISDTAEENARREGRIGLAQMWLRAEAVGGLLDVRSHAGGGTEVRFEWSA